MPEHIYWIKFPNQTPFRIVMKEFVEFLRYVETLSFREGGPFEWLIRE